jgi:hypothetical protein
LIVCKPRHRFSNIKEQPFKNYNKSKGVKVVDAGLKDFCKPTSSKHTDKLVVGILILSLSLKERRKQHHNKIQRH